MARFGTTTHLGQDSTYMQYLIAMHGLGIPYGDGANSGEFLSVGNIAGFGKVGGFGGGNERGGPIYGVNIDPLFWGRTIVSAKLQFRIVSSLVPAVFPTSFVPQFEAYAVRVATSGPTWLNRSSGVPWAQADGKPDVDHEATPTFTFQWTLARHNAVVAAGYYDFIFDLVKEMQRCADRALSKTEFIVKGVNIGSPPEGLAVTIMNPSALGGAFHTFMTVVSLPARAFFGALPDAERSINLGDFKDAASIDLSAHINTGTPQAGSNSAPVVTHLANTTPNELIRNCVVTQRAIAGSVLQPVGGRTLKHIRPYDNATNQGVIEGTARLYVKSGDTTKYGVKWLSFGGSAEVDLFTSTAAQYANFTDSLTVWMHPTISTQQMFEIRSRSWGSTAIVGTENWSCNFLPDIRPSTYAAQAEQRHWITNYYGQWDASVLGGPNRTLPFDTEWRRCDMAYVQQLWDVPYTDVYSGSTVSFIPVRYAADFNPAYSAAATISSDDEQNVEHFVIQAVLPSASAQGGDVLVCDRVLTHAYDAKAQVTTGVFLGKLWVKDSTRLSDAVSADASELPLEAALIHTSGYLRVFRSTDGKSERHAYTEAGTVATLANPEVLGDDYAAGDIVDAGLDAAKPYYKPFFARLSPEAGALRGPQLALIRAISMEIL